MAEVAFQQKLQTQVCCNCGMQFAMPTEYTDRRMEDGKNFYCPSGHPQHYIIGMTAEQKLANQVAETNRVKEKLEWERSQRKTAQHSLAVTKGKFRAMRERVKNGVCPCCNRSFENLQKHMQTKHPQFNKEPAAQ